MRLRLTFTLSENPMKKTFLALILACGTVLAHSQAIRPDTLQDLKAEYAYQRRQFEPWAVLYREAKERQDVCYEAMFANPVGADCSAQERTLRTTARMMDEPMNKFLAAKEAYERAARKVGRK